MLPLLILFMVWRFPHAVGRYVPEAQVLVPQQLAGTWSLAQIDFPQKLQESSDSLVTKKLVFEKIPYAVDITYTKKLPVEEKVYDLRGTSGVLGKVIETTTLPNGKKKTKTVDSWVEVAPQTEYVHEGTTHDYKTAVVDGKTIHYWRTLSVVATSYDKTCAGCNDTTATGAKLKKGIIAVDPKVIPLHTTMYVPGYGYGKAEDTGGLIKGNRIDLAYDDLRYGDWSKRRVTIYILD